MHKGKVSQKVVKDMEDSIWSAKDSVHMGDAGGCGCCCLKICMNVVVSGRADK